jgi:hypothetical protein
MRLNRDSKLQQPKGLPADGAAPRRVFPAWIDAGAGTSFAALVTPRVRDGLILRLVAQAKPGHGRSASDASRAR